jgi:hypothetical protein
MKQTVFRFGVKLHAADTAAQFQAVKDKLSAIDGVVAVEGGLTDSPTEVRVRAEFTDGEAAIKLHRKIMKILITEESLSLAYATTTLTEVFE